MKAALPSNETARLVALRQYQVLDTAAEKAFDDITTLASHICGTPIAVISFVDSDRQWFKSKVGLTVSETSRDIAFCAHAILQSDLMVVPDALQDERFAQSPLVNSDPKVRFYAGMPLFSPKDLPLGTLCVYDRVPRELSAEQSEALRALARQVILLLELRRNANALAQAITDRDRAEAALRSAYAELERHTMEKMEMAREVQKNLFPRRLPSLKTLELVGGCIQTEPVGGDYYDFLDLGPGRLGLVLADVAGKGIAAALLMASLQADLRSHCAAGLQDLAVVLQCVNRLLLDSTEPGFFVTLFFGIYEDQGRRLRYANCGHNAPMMLRRDGTLERLESTATVLGVFEGWNCPTGEVELAPGDLVVMFTDGITEAMNAKEEEFGEARLIETVRTYHHAPVSELLARITAAVENFSGGRPQDDLTLVIARAQ